MNRASKGLLIGLLAVLAIPAGCVGYVALLAVSAWVGFPLATITPLHDNGQLAVLGDSRFGDKEGIWVWFRADGSVIVDDERSGSPRTGFYDDDARVRLLSDEELEAAIRRAKKVMKDTRPPSGRK